MKKYDCMKRYDCMIRYEGSEKVTDATALFSFEYLVEVVIF